MMRSSPVTVVRTHSILMMMMINLGHKVRMDPMVLTTMIYCMTIHMGHLEGHQETRMETHQMIMGLMVEIILGDVHLEDRVVDHLEVKVIMLMQVNQMLQTELKS